MKRKSIAAALPLVLAAGFAVPSVAKTYPRSDEVWVGAPFDGTWPAGSGCGKAGTEYTCSLPSKHWTQFEGDWSVDLPKAAGRDVFLYVAPNDDKLWTVITKVERVSEACTKQRQGGKAVRIGVYINGTKVGQIAYAHLVTSLKQGQTIDRWGTKLGTVFTTDKKHEKCWTGPHVHFEATSSGDRNSFACYNRGFKPSQQFTKASFIGFVTGNRASSLRAKCP